MKNTKKFRKQKRENMIIAAFGKVLFRGIKQISVTQNSVTLKFNKQSYNQFREIRDCDYSPLSLKHKGIDLMLMSIHCFGIDTYKNKTVIFRGKIKRLVLN